MHKITFRLAPVSASRPRVGAHGTYYNAKYQQFREDMAKLLWGKNLLYEEPLRLKVVFSIPIPKSYSQKKKDELHGKYCAKAPDLDNLEKALYDSMNGNIYVDDSQIVHHDVQKLWTKEEGKIEVTIERL
jgi:Holliday junction resolvase RusA-like endonuclease